MVEAPNLTDVKNHKNKLPDAMGCIIIAPKFHKKGFDEILQRLEYLNLRSGENLHLYCAGYGAYWNETIVPDMENINQSKISNNHIIPWAFSQNLFAHFVNELESETNWTYSGGTEIIVLDKNLEFKNCIVFKIDEMIKDKIIESPNEIVEALIQQSRKNKSNDELSLQGIGEVTLEEGIKSILSFLPKPLENIWNIWNKGKHYTLVDLK